MWPCAAAYYGILLLLVTAAAQRPSQANPSEQDMVPLEGETGGDDINLILSDIKDIFGAKNVTCRLCQQNELRKVRHDRQW